MPLRHPGRWLFPLVGLVGGVFFLAEVADHGVPHVGVLSLIVLACIGVAFTAGWRYGRQVKQLRSLNEALDAQRQSMQNRMQVAARNLRQQKEDAEKANASKSRFLAAATHDLRQPLAALNLFAADLERQVHSADRAVLVRLSSRINASARGLRTLIDALLDFSCIDVEKIRPNWQLCELNHLFSVLERTFSCAAEEKRIGLSFRDTPLLTRTDPILLERLLGNLIANAINYTYQGRVVVAARRRGKDVSIEVWDTGIGIPEAQQAHIFEEFYQVENTAREHNKGLGLGLAIVSKLSHALNATISVRSVVGRGSRFSVLLPLPDLGQMLSGESVAWPDVVADEGVAPVHLIGDSAVLKGLKLQLLDWGYEVFQVSTLAELLSNPLGEQTIAIIDLDADGHLLTPSVLPHQLIVLGSPRPDMPPWVHHLSLPLRPARLRTLLGRLRDQTGTTG